MSSLYDMLRGAVVGFAVGDSLGVPVEFCSRALLGIKPVTTMRGYGSHDVPAGAWSDDTSMTLAEMDSIAVKREIDCEDMLKRFCLWVTKGKYTATGTIFDIGITTRKALAKYATEKPPAHLCGGTGEMDNGNGSLMRMLPVAFYCYAAGLDEAAAFEAVKTVSSITHAHELSVTGCFIYVEYVMSLLGGKSPAEAYEALKQLELSDKASQETLQKYSRILSGDIAAEPVESINSTGFVVSTLEASLWSFLNGSDYSSCVLGAVNLGEDTDTIGAITGSLAGIVYGYETISAEWLDLLRNKALISDITKRFYAALDHILKAKN